MSSLSTAVDILNCFSPERPELRVSEVARRLGLPKSTVTRLFKEMLRKGLVEQDADTRAYKPGELAFRLGSVYRAHLHGIDLAEDAVAELVEAFGLTGYIGVLDGTDLVILRARQGWYPVRMVLDPGYRVPAFATAIGRALLARWRDEDVFARHPAVMGHAPSARTITREALVRDLATVRRQGWAEVAELTFRGFGALGVAVAGPDGDQPLGFSLSFPHSQPFDVQHSDMVARLTDAARSIGRKLGDPFWTASDSPPATRRRRTEAPRDREPVA